MSGHIRQRSPGSWELRYSLGTDPATGKRKIATATIKGTRRDAEKELRRLLRAVDTGEHVDPTKRLTENELSDFSQLCHDGCVEAIIEAQNVDRNHSTKV